MRLACADIVDLARHATFDSQDVTPHDIAHIGEVARDVELPHAHDRWPQSGFDLCNLRRKVRRDKAAALPRSDVIERPHPDSPHAVAEIILQPQEVLGDLAHRIG